MNTQQLKPQNPVHVGELLPRNAPVYTVPNTLRQKNKKVARLSLSGNLIKVYPNTKSVAKEIYEQLKDVSGLSVVVLYNRIQNAIRNGKPFAGWRWSYHGQSTKTIDYILS